MRGSSLAVASLLLASCHAVLGYDDLSTSTVTGSGGATSTTTTNGGTAGEAATGGQGGGCAATCQGPCQTCSDEGQCQPEPAGELPACQDGVCDGCGRCATAKLDTLAHLAATGEAEVVATAFDDEGRLAVVGHFDKKLTVVPGTELAAVDDEVFLALYKPSGELDWAKSLGGSGTQKVAGVAFDKSGRIVLAGHTDGKLDGISVGNVLNGGSNVWVAKFGVNGTVYCSQVLGSSGFATTDEVLALAVDKSNGRVAIAGAFTGSSIPVGTVSVEGMPGTRNAYVAVLDDTCNGLWGQSAKAQDKEHATSALRVAFTRDGDVVVGGIYRGTTSFAELPLEWSDFAGDDIFVASLGGGDGVANWVESYRGFGDDSVGVVAAGEHLWVAGTFAELLTVNVHKLKAAGASDVFVARLDPASGKAAWVGAFGDGEDQQVAGGVSVACGNLVLIGDFAGDIFDGPHKLSADAAGDGFLARIGPDGAVLQTRRLGGMGEQRPFCVAEHPDGRLVLGGWMASELDYQGKKISGTDDGFLLRLLP